jgi:hypothetical protein
MQRFAETMAIVTVLGHQPRGLPEEELLEFFLLSMYFTSNSEFDNASFQKWCRYAMGSFQEGWFTLCQNAEILKDDAKAKLFTPKLGGHEQLPKEQDNVRKVTLQVQGHLVNALQRDHSKILASFAPLHKELDQQKEKMIDPIIQTISEKLKFAVENGIHYDPQTVTVYVDHNGFCTPTRSCESTLVEIDRAAAKVVESLLKEHQSQTRVLEERLRMLQRAEGSMVHLSQRPKMSPGKPAFSEDEEEDDRPKNYPYGDFFSRG